MAVIGIGTTSRVTVDEVLAAIAAAKAKVPLHPNPMRNEKTPSLCLSPQGERERSNSLSPPGKRAAVSSLSPWGEGGATGSSPQGEDWDEGGLITALAVLDRPTINPVLREAALQAGLEFVLLTLDDLLATAHLCVTHSEKSMKQYGIPSVAEAAALAGAGRGARLLLPRFCGPNTTASVAAFP